MNNMIEKCRVVIVDDHSLFVDGFKALLSKFEPVEVIRAFNSGEDYLEHIDVVEHDLVFMDISMDGIDGYETTRQLFKKKPQIKVIVVTECTDGYMVDKFLKIGVTAYITKNTGWEELRNIFDGIQNGKRYVTPNAAMNYTLLSIKPPDKTTNENPGKISKKYFSEREIKLMKLLELGKTEMEIAEALHISIKTVQVDKKKIVVKLNVSKQSQIIAAAYQHNILP